MMERHPIAFLCLAIAVGAQAFRPNPVFAQGVKDDWVKHIETLLEVAVHTENDPKFLDWAESYCDSLSTLDSGKAAAEDFRSRINQTREICSENLNHRAPALDLFRGRPAYMGFADDAVEYALEGALTKLLDKPIEFQSTTMVRNGALNAVVVQGDVPADLWEIALDALDVETNYRFLRSMGSPKSKMDSLISDVQIDPNDLNIAKLSGHLGIERLALFEVDLLDVVDERLWMVAIQMRVWDQKVGFGDSISAMGFCEDKARSPILLNLLDVLLWSFLLLIAIAGLEHIHWSTFKYAENKLLFALRIPAAWLRLAVERIPKTALFLFLPITISFLFIQLMGPLVPNATTHYRELDAKLWVIGTALGMSLLPTILNFFMLNRLRLDGFHSMRSYRDLANVSLFGSYVPFMYLHEVNGTPLGFDFVLMLVVATWMASDLLAFNLNELLSSKKSLHVHVTTSAGLAVGVGVIVVLAFDMIGEAAFQTSLQLSMLGGIANVVSRPFVRWAHRKDSAARNATNSKSSLESGVFVPGLVPHFEGLLTRIQSLDFKAGYVVGPMGIGKTRLMRELQQRLEDADDSWLVFFGDCNEVQEKGHLAFEPFVEAFGDFLSITEIGDRTVQMDAIGRSVFSKISNVGSISIEFDDVAEDIKQSLEDFALFLVDRLENERGKMLLILDDVQWMDSDTQRLLEVFWAMVERTPKLHGRIKLILTYRDSSEVEGHRINGDEFLVLTKSLFAENLFQDSSFVVRDFIKGFSNLRSDFTLSQDTLNAINDLFNEQLKVDGSSNNPLITPLYILRTIEQFQADQTLAPGADGWVLTRSLNLDDLPNTESIDAYYHSIFNAHPTKWMRVLESASIVGQKFDATVLASVWGHELLDVLDFLEQLESNGILEDVREEDNVYRFKDKRAIAAVRSYFPNTSGDRNARQIVIEYNKRLLQTEADCVPNRALYSTQQLWSYLERLSQVKGVESRITQASLLMEELAVRFALEAEELGMSSIIKLMHKAKEWGFPTLSQNLQVLATVLEEDSIKAQSAMRSLDIKHHSAPHLLAYIRLLFDHRHSVQLRNGRSAVLSDRERQSIAQAIIQSGQGATWVGVVALLLVHPNATQEEKNTLAVTWKEHPPVLNASMELVKIRFELELKGQVTDQKLNENILHLWNHHWEQVLRLGNTRQRKVVAKDIIRLLLHGEKNPPAAVNWFIENEKHLRSSSGGVQVAWIQTLNCTLLNDAQARKVMCMNHQNQLQGWLEEMQRYVGLRFGEKAYSQHTFQTLRSRLLCTVEWKDRSDPELQAQGDLLRAYVQQFPELHPSRLAETNLMLAEISSPSHG